MKIPTHRHGHTLDLIITPANSTLNPIITSSYIVISHYYPIFTSINVHPNPPPHQQPSSIAVSTPLTTKNSSTTSTQFLSLQTLPATCPICSTYFSQPFAHYSIITPPSSPKPINPLALLSLLGSPLKSSVSSLPAAV